MITVSTFLRSGVLMVWGIVLSYFYFSDRVNNYLHPSFHIWTGVSGIVFILIAAGLIFLPGTQGDDCCDEGHGASAGMGKQIFGAIVLSVPLVIAATFSPSQFGASLVENRGLASSAADLPGYTPQAPAAADTATGNQEDFTNKNEKGQIKAESIDLVYAAEDSVMRQDFENKEVEMIGQYLPARTGNAKGDRFNLVRMLRDVLRRGRAACRRLRADGAEGSVSGNGLGEGRRQGNVSARGRAAYAGCCGRTRRSLRSSEETFVY